MSLVCWVVGSPYGPPEVSCTARGAEGECNVRVHQASSSASGSGSSSASSSSSPSDGVACAVMVHVGAVEGGLPCQAQQQEALAALGIGGLMKWTHTRMRA